MDGLFIGLILLILLAILAAVGHGIWVGTAALIRLLFSSTEEKPKASPKPEAEESKLRRLWRLRGEVVDLREQGIISAGAAGRIIAEFEQAVTALQPPPLPPKPFEAPPPRRQPDLVPLPSPPLDAAPAPAAPSASAVPPPLPLRKVAPEAPPAAQVPPAPAPERETFGEILARFMESRHIRWGELVGGLLILFCSAAWVITAWKQIRGVPWLQFTVFLGVTAFIFGAGLFVHRRWKLPLTAKGLLVIGMLLVPLNCLAIAATAIGRAGIGAAFPIYELLALAIFAVLLWLGAKVLAPEHPIALALGILLPGAVTLANGFFDWMLGNPAVAPILAAFQVLPAAAVAVLLAYRERGKPFAPDSAESQVTQAILLWLAAMPGLWLLTRHGAEPAQPFAPTISLLGIAPMCCGLPLWTGATQKEHSTWQVSGAALTIFGAALYFWALGTAAPAPGWICVVGVLAGTGILLLVRGEKLEMARLLLSPMAAAAFMALALGLAGKVPWDNSSWPVFLGELLGSAAAAAGWIVLAFGAVLAAAKFPGRNPAIRAGTSAWIYLYTGLAIFTAAAAGESLSNAGSAAMLAIMAAGGCIYFRQATVPRTAVLDGMVALTALAFSSCAVFWFGEKPGDVGRAVSVALAAAGSLLLLPLQLRRLESRKTFVVAVLVSSLVCVPLSLWNGAAHLHWWYSGMMLWAAANCVAAALIARSPLVVKIGQSLFCAALAIGAGEVARLLGTKYPTGLEELFHAAFGMAVACLVLFGAKSAPGLRLYREITPCRIFAVERYAAIAATCLFCLVAILIGAAGLGVIHPYHGNISLAASTFLAALLMFAATLDRKDERKNWAMVRLWAVYWSLTPFVATNIAGGLYLDRFQWTLAFFHLGAFVLIWLPVLLRWPRRPVLDEASEWLNSTIYSICMPVATVLAFVYWFGPEANDRSGFDAFAPFVLMAGVQFAHGLLQQQNAALLFSALMMHFGLTSYLIAGARPQSEPPALLLAYWNTAVCGFFTMLWCALPFLTRPRFKTNASKTRRAYLYAGLTVLLVAGTVGVIWIFLEPWDVDPDFAYAASPAGWLAVAFICVAWLAVDWMEGVKSKLSRFGIPAFVAVEHVGAHYQARIGWDGLSALAVGFAVAMFVPLGAGLAGRRFPGVMDERFGLQNLKISVRNWMRAFALLCVLCCVRIWLAPEAEKLPMSMALGVASVAFAVLAFQQGTVRFLIAAGLFLNAAVSLWWIEGGAEWLGIGPETSALDLTLVNLGLLIFPGICSQIMERRIAAAARLHPVTGYIASIGLLILAVTTYLSHSDTVPFTPWIASLAILGTAACSTWSLVRGAFRLQAMRSLQILGLAAAGFVALSVVPAWRDLSALFLLALFAAGVATLTRRVSVQLEDPGDLKDIARWTRAILTLAALAAVLLAIRTVLSFGSAEHGVELWTGIVLRGFAALVPLAYAIGNRAIAGRKIFSDTLWILVLILVSWAPIEPGSSADLPLNRLTATMAAMGAATWVACAFSLWGGSVIRERALMLGAFLRYGAAISVMVLLTAEFIQWSTGRVEMSGWAIVLGAVVLAINMGIALAYVLVPRTNPAPLSTRALHGYVYAAEALLVALVLHLRLSAPWIFHGFLEQYWPLLIMGVAFVGAGMGEWFERKKLTHLSVPIGRTAVFLPLLPALAFWARSYDTDYSLVMLVAGAFYAVLSFVRSSFNHAFAAGIACNIALWYFLGRTEGFAFTRHPQFWVIPFAGSVLAALYAQRSRLPEGAFRTGRLFCIGAIYLSSTVELFINGVGHSFWLPLILGALSIAGVLAGMGFRIQSFLYLGSFFLLVDLTAIVWHAASNLGWTWLWYVAGIAAGLSLIAAFGLMEKRGPEFRRMLVRLKTWD